MLPGRAAYPRKRLVFMFMSSQYGMSSTDTLETLVLAGRKWR